MTKNNVKVRKPLMHAINKNEISVWKCCLIHTLQAKDTTKFHWLLKTILPLCPFNLNALFFFIFSKRVVPGD